MKTKELREKSPSELEKALRDTREELLNLRLRKQTGQVEHSHQLKELRRELARIQTLLREQKPVENRN